MSEAMEELRCSESTIRRLIQSGELPAVKIGSARAIRVQRRALDALLEPVEPGAAAALADAADAYLGLAKRVDGLRAADRRLAQVRIPAIDSGAELVRLTAGYRDVALPLPTELR